MKLLLLLTLPTLLNAQLCSISGVFKNPDGTNVTGTATIQLPRANVTNSCVTPAQVIPFYRLVVKITNGTFPATNLYQTGCLTPNNPYSVTIQNSLKQTLYKGNWTVPTASSADVSTLDSK
jgi:hypothetical protein